MDDFLPATVYAYSTWPKGTPNYYALPAMGDALGWTYRKDWFSRPELQAEFKQKYNRDLAPPKTWTELKQIAEFFQNRADRRQEGLRRGDLHRARLGGHHHGRDQRLYAWGFQYDDPKKPYAMDGFTNSKDAVEALEFYKSLYKCCTPPGYTNAYMQEGLDAFKSGQVAMQMNWFAFFPGLYKDEKVGGDKIGFFVNPAPEGRGLDARRPGHLGRLLLAEPGRGARIHQVVRAARRAEEVVGARRLRVPQGGGRGPELHEVRALRGRFSEGHGRVKDFWQEPAYAQLLLDMQKRVHDYVVADKGTAKEALDRS